MDHFSDPRYALSASLSSNSSPTFSSPTFLPDTNWSHNLSSQIQSHQSNPQGHLSQLAGHGTRSFGGHHHANTLGSFDNINTAYMHAQERIATLEKENRALNNENISLNAQLISTKASYDKLVEKMPSSLSGSTDVVRSSKAALPPLDRASFPNVKYWTKVAYRKAVKETAGDTNALATAKRKRGRPKQHNDSDNEEEGESKHPYIEDARGAPISKERLWSLSCKARQCWTTLQKHNIAPASWKNAESDAVDFFVTEMEHEFPELRLCDNHWKLDHWATLSYPSFAQNHIKNKDADGNKMLANSKQAKKVKKEQKPQARKDDTIPDRILDELIPMDIDDTANITPNLPAQHKSAQEATPIVEKVVQSDTAKACPVPVTIQDPLGNLDARLDTIQADNKASPANVVADPPVERPRPKPTSAFKGSGEFVHLPLPDLGPDADESTVLQAQLDAIAKMQKAAMHNPTTGLGDKVDTNKGTHTNTDTTSATVTTPSTDATADLDANPVTANVVAAGMETMTTDKGGTHISQVGDGNPAATITSSDAASSTSTTPTAGGMETTTDNITDASESVTPSSLTTTTITGDNNTRSTTPSLTSVTKPNKKAGAKGGAKKAGAKESDAKAGGTKADKPLPKSAYAIPGSADSVMNLCMREWLETHPGGLKVDFKAYYANITEDQKAHYNDLSKALKGKRR